ncbi:MAG: PKD domain-containing protein, partial [Crocinitomicaceae bacterium]
TCPEIITRTYSITDDCGNVTTVAQTITVDDITPPTGTAPTDIIVECIGDVPIADPAAVTDEADNCTATPTVTVADVSDGATCPETITRTYTITDDCGNTTDVVQTITIDDTTDPTASNPAPITVNCIDDVPAPNPAVVTDEADNCTANPTVIFVSDASDGNACNNETITRTYQIMDDCGNTAEVTQIITIEATPPTVDAGLDESICEGETVTLNATTTLNGGDVVTISWDQGVVDGVSFNPPVGINTYTATAAVCNGACFSTNQVEVVVSPNPQVAFMANNTTVCETHDIEFTNQSTNQYQCTWDFGNGITASGCATQTIAYDMSGVYDVSLTVTSDQGCTTSETYNDYIEIVPYPVAAFNYSPTELDVTDTEVNFDNQSMFADTYEWNFGDFSPNSSNTDPVHVYPDASGASYTVTLLASSNAGCYDQASAVINIKDILLFYVPNVFTPDGNSINNEFSPVFTSGVDVYDFHMTIFNRWGEVVFESYDPSVGWDGTYGQGGLVPEGVYVWQLDFGEKMSDKRHKHRGHVTVLK